MRHRRHRSRLVSARGCRRDMAVVDEVELACHPRSRLATGLGVILGGVIPIATYLEAHYDLSTAEPLHTQAAAYMVAGGLLFSAKTVFAWGKRAFSDGWKAAGFVLLLEGVMITSGVRVLPLVLLAILVAINGIATGCALSLDRTGGKLPPLQWPLVAKPAPSSTPTPTVDAASHIDAASTTAIVTLPRSPNRSRRDEASQERFVFLSDAS